MKTLIGTDEGNAPGGFSGAGLSMTAEAAGLLCRPGAAQRPLERQKPILSQLLITNHSHF
jgi:hypothetical protein